MDRIPLLFISLFLSVPVQSAVYKCEIDGVVTFSQDPCGEETNEVDYNEPVNVISSQNQGSITSSQPRNGGATNDKQAISDYVSSQRIKREIKNLQNDRKKVLKARDKRLANLRNSRRFAANNAAGANYLQSLAGSMQAANQEADTEISSIDRQITHLRSELNSIKSE